MTYPHLNAPAPPSTPVHTKSRPRILKPIPSLQDLVDQYDGFHLIPEIALANYRVQLAAWSALHRSKIGAVQETMISDEDPLANLMPLRDQPPSRPILCISCDREARFGYKSVDGSSIDWFCAQHRLAKYWADARR